MVQLALRIPIPQPDQPAGVAVRTEPKKATRCSRCRRIVWQDETLAGWCPDCVKEHHAEILGDDVG